MAIREIARGLVAQMTLAEKASLCSGKNFWYLKGVSRLGLPEIMVTDGPNGLRKQATEADHLGINRSIPAVCFPTASATACSFDRDLMNRLGRTIGEECRQEAVSVLLGPGINIKRSPLCGRNFEYISEDPFVSGELAAAFIDGVQSQNVGVSLKHFAANNQEKRRLTTDSVMDERTFREIYLAGFELAVKKAKPWTVMCSYNSVSGEFASQNKRLLTEILRDEWGFAGAVISDWGATVERVKGLEAGLDIEMPWINGTNDSRIVQAVEHGRISTEVLDRAALRITELILRSGERRGHAYDADAHHALARQAAAQSAVLLKNDRGILPGKAADRAAVIGAFARQPRYQGTGSSKIVPIRVDNALEELKQQGLAFEYAEGYLQDADRVDETLIGEACRVAAGKDIVYLFAGLPDSYEAETYDRDSMAMPESHVKLIEAVARANAHVVVVLHGGAPMETSWADRVQGILLMSLGGEACGSACADLLLGQAVPCGKLAETWPFTESDAPSHPYFPGYPLTVEYREGLFVGYRFYDTAQVEVRYPFGYGLSYTEFEYSDIRVSADRISDTDTLEVSCTIRNTGSRAGSEIAQLYVARRDSVIIHAEQELKGFEKVHLEAGESASVTFALSKRDFAYYNTAQALWHVESGPYEIRIGASSRDIRLSRSVHVESTVDAPLPDWRDSTPGYYNFAGGMRVSDQDFTTILGRPIPARERVKGSPHTINSTITDIQDKWLGRLLLKFVNNQINRMAQDSADMKLMAEKMIRDIPLRFLTMLGGGAISIAHVEGFVDLLNGSLAGGLAKLLRKETRQNEVS